jgi:farnesyl-diphosphate farnesyltransferase
MIGIVTAMPEELAALLRRTAITRTDGNCHVGTLNGAEVVITCGDASELLAKFEVERLIGAGIAGACDPALRAGEIVSGGTGAPACPLRSVNHIVNTVAEKAALFANGIRAVDMESDAWSRAAGSVPFTNVRVILDPADEAFPPFITTDRAAVARYALRHPSVIPYLLRLRRRVHVACESLAEYLAGEVALPERRLHELLAATSRTFALCIPLLPDETRLQVTIAYLLFRIADTFEDASHWPVADRLAALDELCALLRDPRDAARVAAAWHAKAPAQHPGYVRLIADAPLVLRAFVALPDAAHDVVRDHVIRSAQGMAHFVALTENGSLQLTSLPQLRDYCYAVAGIVGEMLTELFLLRAPALASSAPFLRARAAAFGEGLQLVNILKDAADDQKEGRTYIPADLERAAVASLARRDLQAATEYTLALQSGGAPPGIVSFAALPVALAQATLDKLERHGAGAKIGRVEVFRLARAVADAVRDGRPPLRPRAAPASGFARLRALISAR